MGKFQRYWTKFERYWKILVNLREIEGIWDRYREIGRILDGLIRYGTNFGGGFESLREND